MAEATPHQNKSRIDFLRSLWSGSARLGLGGLRLHRFDMRLF